MSTRKAISLINSLTWHRCEYIVIRSQKISHEDTDTAFQTLISNMSQFAERSTSYLSKISQAWSPEYSPSCDPLICCTLIIIATAGVQFPDHTRHGRDIARILLGHYANYWRLGTAMLRKYLSPSTLQVTLH